MVFLSIFKDAECKMTKKKIKKQVVEFPVLAIKMYLYQLIKIKAVTN